MPHPLLIDSQIDSLIQDVDINSQTKWQTVQIQISWLLKKPTDLDLHCLQRQGISRFCRTRVKSLRYSKTCVRQPPLKLTVLDVERWLSYKGTCYVILLAKLHDMYLYKTDNFFHINHYLKSVSNVALLHRFYCNFK